MPETITVCRDRKYVHCKITDNFFPPPPVRKTVVLALALALHTMLQQLQNLASNDTIHGYQTCLLVESFYRE